MKLSDELNIKRNDVISIVGAGGKTTLMFKIAREMKDKGLKVLVTTSTKIFYPKESYVDNIILLNENKLDVKDIKEESITVIGDKLTGENKLTALDEKTLFEIQKGKVFDLILIEADGAKGRPIKAPNFHEPVISKLSTKTIGFIGLDALGLKARSENVHRIDEFLDISGLQKGKEINKEAIRNLISSQKGLFKNTPTHTKKILILNKADNKVLQDKAYELGKYILNSNIELEIFITSLHNDYIRKVKL